MRVCSNSAKKGIIPLEIPVSVVINALYHQVIARNGVPFSLTLPSQLKPLEEIDYESGT